MKNKCGFTLVELLAVITLLALLMGIAIPNIVSTINNSKRSDFLADAKRMISKAEYLLSIDRTARNSVQNGTPKVYYFSSNIDKYLNEKNEFPNDADGGAYDTKSYVKITYSSSGANKVYNYCICLVGSKRKIGSNNQDTCDSSLSGNCVDSKDLSGIDIVKDKSSN